MKAEYLVAAAARYYAATGSIDAAHTRLGQFWATVRSERSAHADIAAKHAEAMLDAGKVDDDHAQNAYLALRRVEYDRLEAMAAERRILTLADCLQDAQAQGQALA